MGLEMGWILCLYTWMISYYILLYPIIILVINLSKFQFGLKEVEFLGPKGSPALVQNLLSKM